MCTYMLRLGQISVVICTAVASGTMFQVEAAASSVRITTIPSKGPFRLQQTVQFSCEVEPAQSGPYYLPMEECGVYIWWLELFQ